MSVYYELYLEGWLDGKWICMDSFMRGPDGQLVHRPLLSGQSIVRELLHEVDAAMLELESLSPEVRGQFGDPDERFGPRCYFFEPEVARIPREKYEYERYVYREDMNAFENGDLESIGYWLTEAEYAALSEEERRAYTFFRWDDPWSTFAIKRRLTERVKDAVNYYNFKVLPYGTKIERTRIIVRAS